jgi:hypothetical protein
MGASKPGIERADVLTPEQTAVLKKLNVNTGGQMEDILSKLGYNIEGNQLFQGAEAATQQRLSDFDPAQTASNFEQFVGQPARTAFQEQTAPGIAERFAGIGGARSSASQLALGGAGQQLEQNLAAQKSNALMTAEQQKEQIRNQAIQQALQLSGAPGQQGLSAIDRYTALLNQGFNKQFDIGVDQGSAGLAPALIQGGSMLAAAKMMGPTAVAASSRKVKENIEDFDKGLELVENMDVKKYDYKEEFIKDGKNKIGLIAEELPEEFQQERDGILHVDLYGLLSVAINAIKELSEKVKNLEAK